MRQPIAAPAHGEGGGYARRSNVNSLSPSDHGLPARSRSWSSAPKSAPGTEGASRSVRSTATATPRPPVIAPTGTIGLVMDCDTTGIEPDFALVKFKKAAPAGGYFKDHQTAAVLRTPCGRWANREARDRRDRGLCRWATGFEVAQAPGINPQTPEGKGLHRRDHRHLSKAA